MMKFFKLVFQAKDQLERPPQSGHSSWSFKLKTSLKDLQVGLVFQAGLWLQSSWSLASEVVDKYINTNH
jgi:hypothetical protein